MTTSNVTDSVIGFAVGDAMGVPNEFLSRKRLMEEPLTEMIGFGSHPVLAGTFSDDTSMCLATIDSVINKKKIDYNDILYNFTLWLKENKFTASNYVFDVNGTVLDAITKYIDNNYKGIYASKTSLDNASLMRMFPIALYAYYKQINDEELYTLIKKVSGLTHSNDIVILGCYIYVKYFICLLGGKNKIKSYELLKKMDYGKFNKKSIKLYNRILNNDISSYKLKEINSSDNVVDTLEATLWCILKSDSYAMSVIGAINLGDDTDTIGALTGALAGIIYGSKSIPKEWLDKLLNKDYLLDLSSKYEIILKEKNLYKQLQFTM